MGVSFSLTRSATRFKLMSINRPTLKSFLTRELSYVNDQFVQVLDAALDQLDCIECFSVGNAIPQHRNAQADTAQGVSNLVGHLCGRLADGSQRLGAPRY